MEANPVEAVKNNVFGTRNVVDAALKAGVERFVLISTDKAVEPASVYGASKLLAEEIVLREGARAAGTSWSCASATCSARGAASSRSSAGRS